MMWSSDPVRDAERYQADLEDMPHIYCDKCGSPLYEDDMYFDIGGQVWCEDCAKYEFRKRVKFD